MGAGLTSSIVTPYQPNIVFVDTPDGSDTTWTPAAHRLFTITGLVRLRLQGDVIESLTEGNGDETIEVGVIDDTAGIIAQFATPVTITVGDIFIKSGTSESNPIGHPDDHSGWCFVSDKDIDLLVAGSTGITNGKIRFYCEWVPYSDGALLVPAVWD